MRRLADERGGVAVMVAVLLVVLFGIGAIVIDAGALYAERRQLQNGADAGALAVADDCAGGNCGAYDTTAQPLADANANDNAANVEEVCGDGPGLPGCADPPDLPPVNGYVRVRTRTGDAGGAGVIPPMLSALIGNEDGTTVRAESIVAWGTLGGSFDLFPLAFCWDEFNQLTNNGTIFGPPQYQVFYNTPSQPIECPTSENTYPGGFGWLNITHANLAPKFDPTTCRVTATFDDWEYGRAGVGLPNTTEWNTCVAKLKDKVNEVAVNPDADPLLVPIFDAWKNPGSNGQFRLVGFGAFMPTGYHLGGSSWHPSNDVCINVANRCIRGYFVEWVVTAGAIGAGDYYGVQTIQLMG